jgi:prepilin-type N-terminal cleavage/methylation domain-containing protein
MYSRKAFTLIEVMVVISLLMLFSSFAIMHISFFDTTVVRLELDKLMAACLYMQQLAIATNEEKHLVFDEQKSAYYFDTYSEKLSQRVRFGFLRGVNGPPGSPIDTIEKAITFPLKRISFYPTGIISSGTVYFVDRKKQVLYALSNAVSHVSYLRLYSYTGAWNLYGTLKK